MTLTPQAIELVCATVLKPASKSKTRSRPVEEIKCSGCGGAVAAKGLCGECSCEDDGALW